MTADRPAFEPFEFDNSAGEIAAAIDARAGNWWLTDVGDYHAAAALAADADGTNQRPIIVLEWPARLNHSEQRETIRMLIDPEDAFAISGLLMHSVRWLEECKARGLIP